MRNYLVEVHGTLLQTLANLMNDYSTNLLLYKDGYYQIDGDLHTKLPGKEFTRLHSDLKGSRDKLKPEIELLKTTKSDISDLVSYEGSSHTSTVMNYNFLMNQIKNLDTSITQYESSHSSQDLSAFKELLAATKALIAEHSGKSRNVGTYQSGDLGVGVFTAVIGIVAIVSTMGAATPLVVAGGVVGLGTSVYGLSNAGEGIHNIQLGNAGDIQTKSYNLIRDTAFMGNDKLYHEVGNAFVTASAIMIPIGKTQSVVQGLTEFAIGEAGAYTAGQTAYHVTKFAGGSEEDAQTANFLGNLIGGYVTSSAASKFSLNKVKVDVEVPKYNKGQILKNIEESKLARESSNFDKYLAKEKLQRSLNKPPLVSRELPKLKGVHDVEVPKYNREQILKNLEESKLARESSKFDNYLRKEYAQQGKYFAERITMPNGKRAYLSADVFEGKQVPVRSRDFVDAQGKIKWPPRGTDGFVVDSAGNPITQPANLKAGQVIDRFGSNGGCFASPVDNGEILPFNTRGLPYPEGYQVYHQYEVVKDINLENVKAGFSRLSDTDKMSLQAQLERFGKTLDDLANPQKGQIAKVFGQGGGVQIKFETTVKWYEKMGLLKEIK